MSSQDGFEFVKGKIKVKLFDFDDEFDNSQIMGYVKRKLSVLGFANRHKIISYGEHIKFLKIEVMSYDDIIKLASINGVKTVSFFQEYSLPRNDFFFS